MHDPTDPADPADPADPTDPTDPADPSPTLDVVGVGSPLVDILTTVDDAELGSLGFTKGTMALIDLARAEEVYAAMGPTTEVSGGSVANAMVGIAALGGGAGFMGKVADDPLGQVFTHDIRAAGVEFSPPATLTPPSEDLGTGRCLVLVSGDGERTMATHLGVAGTLAAADLAGDLLARARLLLLEGYLWDVASAKHAMREAAATVHRYDGSVALSLSDPFCVQRHRKEFLELLRDDVDVVFANEEEVMTLFGAKDFEGAVRAMEETGLLAALTRGAGGSVVVTARGPVAVPASRPVAVVDTTAAGDMYAAGFLFGLCRGAEPEDCARLGGLCAAEIIDHLGARPRADLQVLAAKAGLDVD